MARKRGVLWGAALFLVGLPAPEASATMRPAKTEESAVVPGGSLRISAGYERATGPGDAETSAVTASVAIGLTSRTDLTVDGAYLHLESPGQEDASGWGDPTIAMRARIADDTRWFGDVEYTLGVKLPSGDHVRHLGTEETDFFTYLHAAYALQRAELHLNAGFAIVGLPDRPHEQSDSFLYSLALDLPVAGATSLLVDLFAEHRVNVRRNPFASFEDYGHGMLVGLRTGQSRITWDAALFHPLDGHTDIWGLTAGITCRIP